MENGKGKQHCTFRAWHAQGTLHKRGSTFYFYSSSIPELIGRDRVDHQLYPGTFTYSGPRCGFWTLGQASRYSDVPQLSSNRTEGRGPFSESRPVAFPHHITNTKRLFEARPNL